jgi:ribonuclease BN (tRNA processing enzyme)
MTAVLVTLLGTGTIVPSTQRGPTAVLIDSNEGTSLFDCGPATLEAVEKAGHSFRTISRLFLTHYHPDHTLGFIHLLAARRIRLGASDCAPLAVYGPPGLSEFIERLGMLYPSLAAYAPDLDIVETAAGNVFRSGRFQVTAAEADHGSRPAFAYRVEEGDTRIVISGDTAYTEAVVALASGADLLLAECSAADDSPVEGHLTPADVGRMARRADVGRVVLVHLYPVFAGTDPAAGVRSAYHGPVDVGYDGMTIALEARGR